ncbi:PREDICTED: uncharacterized protein LOC109354830 [Lupinus angustifolius]|uniref:uncharacterized protein LOC109354830 n=1 Tax=Lupinus angustifolius TaxID=3871 RepID=UPI00092F3CF9|nr:PREDICTED: uncharacterized protein LOC109354830 [Lupinus angustifolius]
MSNHENSQQSFDVADEDFASPRVTKESAPNENKKKAKPKAVRKTKKRRASKNKPCPRQGLHVYLDFEGIKTIGSICSYDSKTNLYQVEFMLEGKPTRYATEEEILRNKATPEQVMIHNAGCVTVRKMRVKRCAIKNASTRESDEESDKESSSQQNKKTR